VRLGEEARGHVLYSLLPKGSSLYKGWGAPYPPPQASPRAAAMVGGAQLAPKTLTQAGLGQGLGRPLFFFLPHGLLSRNWPIRSF
jgi:hypothetical protein